MEEYDSALKRNEVRKHSAPWIHLENITLNTRSQAQRPHAV